jgi:hypothetical protein
MPTFSSAQVTDPFLSTNELLAPMLAYVDRDSKLGELDINRQRLQLERDKLAQQREAGAALLGGGDAGGTGGAPADSTPFEQKMGAAEGGATADKVNDGGYAGQFQFGAGRLADLGLYTPAPGEDLKANQWKGKFNIAPYNVSTLQDFLNNPAAQHAAFVAHVADIDKTIDATPGADKFDRNGLRAVAHLAGTGGMQAFIASGGNLNRHDSNGTTLKAYYQRFADGGAPALQKAFGSVHGPAGPPSDLPAVQPGGNVGTAWVDPNAPLPVPPVPPATVPPPFNPNAGPRVTGAPPAGAPGQAAAPGFGTLTPVPGAPTVTGQADAPVPVTPSRIALRLGGTDTAGPGAGPDTTLPPVAQPNRLYETGLPGVTISGPGNALAPPVAAAPVTAPPPPATAPAGVAPPGGATRPPILQPPPAPSRVIPMEPLIQSGPAAGLTEGQRRIAAAMVAGGTPVADVGAHMAQWRQQNIAGQQQAATNAALEAQANFERQKYFREQQIEAEKTQYQRRQDAETARRNAAADARAEVTARNAGLPTGYRMGDDGRVTRIDGLPPDPAIAEAAKAAFEAEQRKQPFQGNSEDAQNRNILLTGDPKSPAYHSAYASFADPKTQEGGLIVKHNMQPYRMPQDQDGNPITTYDQPNISIGPGDLTKLRAFETGAATLKSALDDFAKTSRNASAGEWTATVAGQPTDLSAAWTNAALMAKGTALYELGVLSGPDMTVLRGALADPSTFRGAIASNATIDKQVARIKSLLDTRLDQARRSYGGGMSTSGAAPPAQTAPPANRPPLASFAR